MSQESVELLRDAIDRWNRGETRLSAFHPDVEWLPLRVATEGVYRGIAGVERFLADTEQIFEEFELRCELLDLGEQVLAWGTIHVRARSSGIETDIAIGGVAELREGKILRWEDFGSKDKALQGRGTSWIAMSVGNVQLVKSLMAAVDRRDIDAFAEVTTQDLEWFPVFAARVGGDVYRGREGIEAFLGEVDETWEEFRPMPKEYRDLGDRVLALGRLRTRGRASGAPGDSPWGGVYDLRDGKVSRIRTFLDHAEALRAAGLSE